MKKPAPVIDLASLPLLLTLDEIAAIYRVSAATIRRQVQEHTFRPPPFDKYPYRWLRADVERDLLQRRGNQRQRAHGFAKRGAAAAK